MSITGGHTNPQENQTIYSFYTASPHTPSLTTNLIPRTHSLTGTGNSHETTVLNRGRLLLFSFMDGEPLCSTEGNLKKHIS